MKTLHRIFVGLALVSMGGCANLDRESSNQYSAWYPEHYYTADEHADDKPDLPKLDENAGLTDYLRYAALNNAGLRKAFEQWRAAINRIPQAKALPDPQFTYSYFIREIETRVGPQKHKLTLMQKFPWFGTLEARSDSAAAAARAARENYQAKKLQVFMKVKDAYAEYAYLYQAIEIARENLQLLEHFEQVARTKYKAATASHPDLIRAQVEMAKLQDVLDSLKDLKNPVVAEVNAVLNRPSDAELPPPNAAVPKRFDINRDHVAKLVKSRNPNLRAIDHLIEQAEHKIALARKRYFPDIGVGVTWIPTGEAVTPPDPSGPSGSGTNTSGGSQSTPSSMVPEDSGTDAVMLTFAMNLPIWWNSYAAGERQARARAGMRRYSRRDTENALLVRAEKTLYEYDDSVRKLDLYGATLVPKAEQLLKASETAYASGKVDFLSLIDAQRMLLKFKLEYAKAVRDSNQTLAGLEMLAGTSLGKDGT